MIADAKQVAPNKPFFMYFCTGAMHAPHHVPKEWADKYKGKFDAGWDAYREQVFEKQKELGLVPAEHDAVAARSRRAGLGQAAGRRAAPLRADDGGLRRLPRAHRPLHRRADRVPQGARRIREHADHGDLGQRRQRRGRSERLGQRRQVLQQRARRPEAEPGRDRRHRRTEVLQPLSLGLDPRRQHAVPALEARDLSRRRVGSRSSSAGPRASRRRGEIRTQYCHAIDMVPTVLDALGIEPPTQIRGVTQSPIAGLQPQVVVRRRQGAVACTSPSTSRCSATARSITTAGVPSVRGPAPRSPSPG